MELVTIRLISDCEWWPSTASRVGRTENGSTASNADRQVTTEPMNKIEPKIITEPKSFCMVLLTDHNLNSITAESIKSFLFKTEAD